LRSKISIGFENDVINHNCSTREVFIALHEKKSRIKCPKISNKEIFKMKSGEMAEAEAL